MKKLIILLSVLVLGSCNNGETDHPIDGIRYTIVEAGGCEYVISTVYQNSISTVHHGNCHNPAHSTLISDNDSTSNFMKIGPCSNPIYLKFSTPK